MTDVERWIHVHETELRDVADRAGARADTVRLLATLVLGGASDPEVYDALRAHVLSLDGQRNPLEGTAELLDQVRRLVAST
jgi:hypothetical protein